MGLGVAVMVCGCGPRLIPVLSTPTRYEEKIPAQYDIAARAQGKIAVLVQGAPSPGIRLILTDAILLELEKKTSVKKSNLVPGSAMADLRKDEQRYLSMSQAQIGEAVGAGTVLVVKIVNYGLYPLPTGGYYDATIKVSATLIDVKTGVLLWPVDGPGREVSLAYDAERGTPDSVSAKILTYTAHGVARFLYDCPKAYFRTPGEQRTTEWDN
jgi:hypothetical protein